MIKMIEQPASWNFKIVPTVHDYFGDVDLEKTKYYVSEIATLYEKDPNCGRNANCFYSFRKRSQEPLQRFCDTILQKEMENTSSYAVSELDQ